VLADEPLDERRQVDRRLVHRIVARIRDEREVDVRVPLAERLAEVVLLETRQVLAAADDKERR
jgi:hypothetical protein